MGLRVRKDQVLRNTLMRNDPRNQRTGLRHFDIRLGLGCREPLCGVGGPQERRIGIRLAGVRRALRDPCSALRWPDVGHGLILAGRLCGSQHSLWHKASVTGTRNRAGTATQLPRLVRGGVYSRLSPGSSPSRRGLCIQSRSCTTSHMSR